MVNIGPIQRKEYDCVDPEPPSVPVPRPPQPFSCPPLPPGAAAPIAPRPQQLPFINVQKMEHYEFQYVRLQPNQRQRQDITLLRTNPFCDDEYFFNKNHECLEKYRQLKTDLKTMYVLNCLLFYFH